MGSLTVYLQCRQHLREGMQKIAEESGYHLSPRYDKNSISFSIKKGWIHPQKGVEVTSDAKSEDPSSGEFTTYWLNIIVHSQYFKSAAEKLKDSTLQIAGKHVNITLK